MKKNETYLYMAILILLIVFFISTYKISISASEVTKSELIIIQVGLIVITIILLLIIVVIYNKKELKPEKVFLYVVPIFCILLAIAIPATRGHDEYFHWIRTYEISEGVLTTPIKNNKAISTLPKAVNEIIFESSYGVFKYKENLKFFDVEMNKNEVVDIENSNAALYCFIQYLPQSVGIAIGRIFTNNPLSLLYLGRLANIITCCTLMYLSIKLIPFGKNILLTLSIIPISIEGFSTLSPDGLTICISCLYLAYILNIIFDEKRNCGIKEMVPLTIMGAILSLCKIVYFPLLFLVLLIPKQKFKSRRKQILFFATIILIGLILNFTWLYFSMNTLSTTHLSGTEDSISSKIILLLKNPLEYLQKAFYTIGLNANGYFISIFGGQLEWNETVKIEIVSYILAMLMLISTMSDKKFKKALTRYQKTIIILVVIMIVGLIVTSLYLQWSNTKLSYINGIQGRYFLPILLLIMFVISNIKIEINYTNSDITKCICISSLIIQMYTIVFVIAEHI